MVDTVVPAHVIERERTRVMISLHLIQSKVVDCPLYSRARGLSMRAPHVWLPAAVHMILLLILMINFDSDFASVALAVASRACTRMRIHDTGSDSRRLYVARIKQSRRKQEGKMNST
jgi:hypothetical protein